MRILILSPYFPPEGGGLESYALTMAGELAGEHEVRVICMSREKSSLEEVSIGGKTLFLERVKAGLIVSNTPVSLRFLLRVFSLVRSWRPDLIVAHTPVPFAADVAALASPLFDVSLIVIYHTIGLKKGSSLDLLASIYSKTLEKFTMSQARLLVAVSSSVRDYLREMGFPSLIIPPRPKPGLFDAVPDKIPPKKKVIIFVGQLFSFHRFKNFELLLRSFAGVSERHPNWELWVVGGGDELPTYHRLAQRLGVGERVRFFGSIPDSLKLAEIYSKASILVLPSSFESFGLVVVEGTLFGVLPIVSREVLQNLGVVGLVSGKGLLVLRQKADLPSMLDELLEDPKTLKKVSAMALKVSRMRKPPKRSRYLHVLSDLNLLEKF